MTMLCTDCEKDYAPADCHRRGATLGATNERARIVGMLRKEADESANVVEQMIASEYHRGLRDIAERWASIAAYASQAARALQLLDRLEEDEST